MVSRAAKAIASGATVLAAVGIGGYLMYFLLRMWADPISLNRNTDRLTMHDPQILLSSDPGHAKALNTLETSCEFYRHGHHRKGPMPIAVEADLDGDGSMDQVSAAGISFHIYLSSTGTTLTQWFGNSGNGSVGIMDVDTDGHPDAWRCDGGDDYVLVFYGNSEGRFSRQRFSVPKVYYAAFDDVDGDKQPDLLACRYIDAETTQAVWFRLTRMNGEV